MDCNLWKATAQAKAARNLILKGERYEKSDFRNGINIYPDGRFGDGFGVSYT